MVILKIEVPEKVEIDEKEEWQLVRKDIYDKLGFVISDNGYVNVPKRKGWNIWHNLEGQAQVRQVQVGWYVLDLFDNADLKLWKDYCNKSKYEWTIKIPLALTNYIEGVNNGK